MFEAPTRLSGLLRALGRLLLLLAALLAAEGLSRVFFHFVENYNVEMWKYARLLKEPVNDARSFVQRPGASARIMGVSVKINSYGFRSPEIAVQKPPNVCRILVLGDSMTMGFGVPEAATFPSLMERALNARRGGGCRYQVINAGVGNYNTAQELASWEIAGRTLHPDLVLLAFYINDAEPTPKNHAGFLTTHSVLWTCLKGAVEDVRVLLDPKGTGYVGYYRGLYKGRRWTRYKKILLNVIRESRRENTPLSVIFVPDLHDLAHYPFNDIDGKISRYFKRAGIQAIDCRSAFQGETKPKMFWVAPDDSHPNAAAQRRLAECILNRLALPPACAP